MNDENEIKQVIEEKFTRCPECRSFSVKQSEALTRKEKIMSLFVPVTVHLCSNCSYRFVISGKFSTRLKEKFAPSLDHLPRRPLWLVIPALVILVLVVLLAVSGGKGQEPVVSPAKKVKPNLPVKTKTVQHDQQTSNTGKEPAKKKPVQEQVTEEMPEISSAPTIAGEIVMGSSNRFGVNWRPLGEGVQITRLSNGPLKRAGMLVGDILVEVDGKKVIGDGTVLENARNDVYHGKRNNVFIKVLRNKEMLIFKLIKSR